MKIVKCTLPNVGATVNGIPFSFANGFHSTGELDDALAKQFDGIPGYQVVDVNAGNTAEKTSETGKTPPPPQKA